MTLLQAKLAGVLTRQCVVVPLLLFFFFGCSNSEPPVEPPPPISPVVSILSPANEAQIIDSTVIDVQATDDKGVVRVEIYIDNQLDSSRVFYVKPYKWTWNVASLEDSSLHTIYAKAHDADGYVSSSRVITVVVFKLSPSNLELTFSTDTVAQLQWQDNSSIETGFEIESAVNNGGFELADSVGTNVNMLSISGRYVITDTYQFRVRAKQGSDRSKYSNIVSGTVTTFVAPSNLIVTSTSFDTVALQWQDNTTFESTFQVWSSTDGVSYSLDQTVGANLVIAKVPQVLDTTYAYFYKVRAISTYNQSPYSNTVRVYYIHQMFAGGDFTSVGGMLVNHIAAWDGVLWSPAGVGTDGNVYTLEVYNDELFVAGNFTTAGGTIANSIAKWDGMNWSPVGSGTNGPVLALRVFADELYAGGAFTQAGGTAVNNMARWNGTTWSAAGDGAQGNVETFGVYNDELFAGGNFTLSGGTTVNHVARWDGANWNGLGSGVDNTVYALKSYNNFLYAGGAFTNAAGTSANHLARWNGSDWFSVEDSLGTSANGTVLALTSYLGQLYVGGQFTLPADHIVKWDGTEWIGFDVYLNDAVNALQVYAAGLYAGGVFTSPAQYVAGLVGNSWSGVGNVTTPFNGAVNSLDEFDSWTWETLP